MVVGIRCSYREPNDLTEENFKPVNVVADKWATEGSDQGVVTKFYDRARQRDNGRGWQVLARQLHFFVSKIWTFEYSSSNFICQRGQCSCVQNTRRHTPQHLPSHTAARGRTLERPVINYTPAHPHPTHHTTVSHDINPKAEDFSSHTESKLSRLLRMKTNVHPHCGVTCVEARMDPKNRNDQKLISTAFFKLLKQTSSTNAAIDSPQLKLTIASSIDSSR